MLVRVVVTIVAAMFVVACGSSSADDASDATEAVAAETTTTAPTETTAAAPTTESTAVVTTTTQSSSTTTTIAPTTTTTETVTGATPGLECRRLTDFREPDVSQIWLVVNDGVMGGRSEGAVEFDGETMRLSGVIDTNGGGFSSVRAGLAEGSLEGVVELRIGAITDGRTYEVQVDDAASGRVTHYGAVPFGDTPGGAAGTVDLTMLEPRIFGTVVDAEAFVPELATSIGFILADGVDGPFDLTIDWIDACG